MLHVLGEIILPIFSIIFIGYLLNLKSIIDPAFVRTANYLVYHVAIPAMLLNAIAPAHFKSNFQLDAVFCLLGALGLIFLLAWTGMHLLNLSRKRRGTFLQSSFHSNIGYIAYAIAFYALGEEAFPPAAILSSFLIVAQNVLAIWSLISQNPKRDAQRGTAHLFKSIIYNPVILSVLAGIAISLSGFRLFSPIQRFLTILSGMALPTALLLIGATLSFGSLRNMTKEIVSIGAIKLVCLPLVGYSLMRMAHVPSPFHLPVIILLGAPPATVTYVMATEIGGDPELAATSISVHTLTAAFTYTILLYWFMPL